MIMSYDEMTGNLLQKGKSIATSHRSICLSMLKGLTENYCFLLDLLFLIAKSSQGSVSKAANCARVLVLLHLTCLKVTHAELVLLGTG